MDALLLFFKCEHDQSCCHIMIVFFVLFSLLSYDVGLDHLTSLQASLQGDTVCLKYCTAMGN